MAGRTVIVTGATSGMGRAVAIGMAQAAANLVLVGRDPHRLQQVRQAVAGQTEALEIRADLTEPNTPAHVIASAIETLGGVDCIVHCAGVFLLSPFDESLPLLDEQWIANVRAPYALTLAGLPALRQRKGSVVFFSSIAGKVGFPGATAYCATKGAIEQVTRALAVEEAPNGVRVNAIAPGNVETPMNAHLMADPDYFKAMVAATPLGRNGQPHEVVPLTVLLASDEGSYVTGQSFVVDGGWTAQ
jgi:NAD(P)-dependent dehydrogenase (short-subunit alcohol dehydrogenase family)